MLNEHQVCAVEESVYSVMTTQNIGVLGAGVMGASVAQNLAQTGHSVILIDLSDPILERARRDIAHGLRFKGFFEKAEKRTDARDVLEPSSSRPTSGGLPESISSSRM